MDFDRPSFGFTRFLKGAFMIEFFLFLIASSRHPDMHGFTCPHRSHLLTKDERTSLSYVASTASQVWGFLFRSKYPLSYGVASAKIYLPNEEEAPSSSPSKLLHDHIRHRRHAIQKWTKSEKPSASDKASDTTLH
jgi:hypothetical protein